MRVWLTNKEVFGRVEDVWTKFFAIKILVEKCLEKDRKLFVVFMDLEKAYDRVDRKGLWETLRVYRVGRKLLEGVRSFYENASASVRVNGEVSESFNVEVGVRQGCVMSPWLFNIYGWVYKRNQISEYGI